MTTPPSERDTRLAASAPDADLAADPRRQAALRVVRDVESTTGQVSPPPADPPLFEATTSPIGGDIDAAGDRLAVWADRIELRDSKDRLQKMIAIEGVDRVEVRRRLTSSVLTVVGADGERLVLKGARAEAASRFRDAVAGLKLTTDTASTSTPTAEDLRRLDELAAMGLLTEREVAEKRSLLARRGVQRRG